MGIAVEFRVVAVGRRDLEILGLGCIAGSGTCTSNATALNTCPLPQVSDKRFDGYSEGSRG